MSSAAPQQTYYTVLPPQPPDVGGAIRPISRLLQMEEDAARELLASRQFHVLRRFAKKPNAEGLVGQLNALGVSSFVVSDGGIRGHLYVWCRSANRGAGGMAFQDFDGKPFYQPFDDLLAVTIVTVPRADGTIATCIDLHRKTTPITPRLDASMFDFARLANRQGAGIAEFLADLEQVAELKVDQSFDAARDRLRPLIEDFATAPSMFAPDSSTLPSPYDPRGLRLANVYSFLTRAARLEAGTAAG